MGTAAKKTKAPRKPKMLGDFPSIPNKDRRNPQTIRRMIYDFVVRYYKRNCNEAAVQLEAIRFQHKKRRYGTGITQDGLYKAIRDVHSIKYLLLEAIAIERRVPVSLLLFYTRICADQTEPDGETKVNNLIRGLKLALEDAEAKVNRGKPIDFDDLAHWVDAFVALSPTEVDITAEPSQAAVVEADPNQPTLPGLDLPIQKVPSKVQALDGDIAS